MKILIAVDGSKPSLKAVQQLIAHSDWYRESPKVELLAVHLPVPRVAHTNKAQLERYYQEEGESMLAAAGLPRSDDEPLALYSPGVDVDIYALTKVV